MIDVDPEAPSPPAPAFRLVPPQPRASAIVDPRIGSFGPALLALEDGAVFPGIAFGATDAAGGDLVVNTSQTGYQEVCTDPSYAGQIVVMTYPLIGNYGRVADDDQSMRPWLRALVVANATAAVLDDVRQLSSLLRTNGIPAIAGVDTRALARHLRASGSLRGIVTEPGFTDRDAAVARARAVPRWEEQDFVGQVSPSSIADVGAASEGGPLVGIVDYGLKSNIVRGMRRRGVRVRILPHTISTSVALARDIDGLILSPGPGDPARLAGPVALARAANAQHPGVAERVPTLRDPCGSAYQCVRFIWVDYQRGPAISFGQSNRQRGPLRYRDARLVDHDQDRVGVAHVPFGPLRRICARRFDEPRIVDEQAGRLRKILGPAAARAPASVVGPARDCRVERRAIDAALPAGGDFHGMERLDRPLRYPGNRPAGRALARSAPRPRRPPA